MRIGEIAALVGITTRAVRHYHHVGLLPEPERLPNGYREYTLRDAVVLARIRRLTELGLGLDEVRDVVRDDVGRELAVVLEELDADLARQEAAIRERRARIGTLLAQARDGELSPEGPVSPALGELLRGLPARGAMAAKDREMLALLETTAPDLARGPMVDALRAAAALPGAAERAQQAYDRLDELAGDVPVDDPRVRAAAELLASCVPDDMWSGDALPDEDSAFLRAFFADFAPAQAEAVRLSLRIVTERKGTGS
ncbi:MerR family transcriptional regulator [Streptomyces sp. NPDC004111]|uniref:MerR family transcriptional regulator n=1 Tax=Streptomyces sp. NPDC004111 TaxID=3364690 RepID=UPI0036B4EA93